VTDLRQPKTKIRAFWRGLAAIAGVLIFFIDYAGYTVDRAINSYYIKDFSYPVPDVLTILAAPFSIYLLLVAWIGRWRIVLPKLR
jgi:hypothetical protein